MKLVFTRQREPTFEDFGATIEDDVLVLPEKLTAACGSNVMRDAERFLSMLHTFPSGFSAVLGWTHEQVATAKEGLVILLEGKVREPFLRPPPPREYSFGARPPPDSPHQIGYVVTKEDAGTPVYDLADDERK